ncbi:type II toxin-antitoxin system PemK/MazF family toxin [Bradyrhizobium sp.]|uniref:type II toxin-antitoxin system PemK/MazF family toxin n=1 Tax=Bradyrhizobium sp. TaxID=376 RepID=UPI002DFB37AA|nr:type II toxin-antitoxin system PemK/MazF family toxin [Bradyrhizobium sp.]
MLIRAARLRCRELGVGRSLQSTIAMGSQMRLPDAGDIAWVELDDTRGTEQSGRRPALILTSRSYHETSRRTIICPITRRLGDWPTNVDLPEGLKTEGTVLVDQIHWIDRQQCLFDFIETVPREVLTEVHAKLAALLDINFDGVPG